MAATCTRTDAVPLRPPGPTRRSTPPGAWPLTTLVVGYPVWWLLGLDSLLPLLLAVPMAVQLRRLRRPTPPVGLGWWLLFVLWVLLGASMLWVDAPGAVAGGGASRLLVFGYRLAWYVACTVVLVWVANLPRSVPDRRILGLVGYLFAVCVAGGLLGLVAPDFEVRSLVEHLLPRGIRGNEFVASLVHPQAADVQTVLGRPESRPKAPFPFTNTWGSSLSISLVFLVAWLRTRGSPTRIVGLALLVVAAVPVVYSLNRGLWASVALCLVGAVLLAARRGSRAAVAGITAGATLGVLLLLASPLGSLYQDRLDHQHSNDRRGQLLTATVDSMTAGSPVLGLGTTRDVEGSFASIAGAATPDCPACGVPPLGTQGQLWLVLFSQGWVGLVLFLGFLGRSLARSWRCRTPVEAVAAFVVALFVLQLPIYDTLGMPLYLAMVAIGLVAREQRPARTPTRRPPLPAPVAVALVTVPLLLGLAAGVLVAGADHPARYTSRISVLITPAPVYLDTGPALDDAETSPAVPRAVTVDTEAALLTSYDALAAASRSSGTTVADLRAGITVTAPPSSQILDVAVQADTPAAARAAARAVAAAYLDVRRAYLTQRLDDTLTALHDQLRTLSVAQTSSAVTTAREAVTAQITHLVVTRPSIGRVIRRSAVTPVGTQPVVPIASGAALGLLTGLLLRHRRRSPSARSHP